MAIEPISKAATDAAMQFAMDALRRVPKDNPEAFEAHLTGVLIVFWGALWGAFGTEYAQGFIEQQLRSMEASKDTGVEVWSPPKTH